MRSAPSVALRCAWAAVFLAVAGLLQLQIPGLFDGDTGYHLAVARLSRTHGLLHAFPWTPFSWLAHHYADKELLFHALLVPLASLPPTMASRIAGTLLGAALLVVLFTLLAREEVEGPGLWTLAVLASSSAFVARFAMVRPHLLSIPLALAITWAAVRRRRTVLAACCALYPLCYTAWHLPIALMALSELARWLGARRVDVRGPAIGASAVALGILVHPNFPDTVRLFWIQNVQILLGTAWSGAPGMDLGGEFAPFSPSGLVSFVLLPGLLAAGGVALGWRARGRDALPLAFGLVAVAFLALTLRTQRFIEYLAPFGVAAAALGLHASPPAWPRNATRSAAATCVAVGVAWTLLVGRHPIELLRMRIDPFPPPVAERLGRIIPPGAQVVTCDWRLTGEMLLALPERRFLVALDPVFLAAQDAERHRTWYDAVHHPPAEPAVLLRDTFDARFVLCGEERRWLSFHRALERDPAAALRGVIGFWRVYELRPREYDPPPDSVTERG